MSQIDQKEHTKALIPVRPFLPADSEAVRAIYNFHVINSVATFDTEQRSVAGQDQWVMDHTGRHGAFVAASNEVVQGYGALSRWSPRGGYAPMAQISVYAAPDNVGRGIGRALVPRLIEHARVHEFHTIIAFITGSNKKSQALFEQQGFVPTGLMREVAYKHGAYHDLKILQLML